MKILIVEDNAGIRKVIRSVLAELTDDIYECGDGLASLAVYQEERPDFVLMDIQMLQMGGLAATRKIAEYDPQARVIIVTNYDEPALRIAAEEAGACGYVAKEDLFGIIAVLKALAT